MLFFSIIILLPYYSLIYRKTLYVYTTIYTNFDIFTKLIYSTHTCAYIYILNKQLQFVTDYYTFYQYILCKNCTKLYLNYLMYHFNFNTLTICISLYYIH